MPREDATTREGGWPVELDAAIQGLEDALADVPRADERAEQLKAEARRRVEAARAALHESIVTAYNQGARVGELAMRTGYNRETIRRVLRAAGITA